MTSDEAHVAISRAYRDHLYPELEWAREAIKGPLTDYTARHAVRVLRTGDWIDRDRARRIQHLHGLTEEEIADSAFDGDGNDMNVVATVALACLITAFAGLLLYVWIGAPWLTLPSNARDGVEATQVWAEMKSEGNAND